MILRGDGMSDIIELIVIFVLLEAFGIWYLLAGFYGWRYPKIRLEWTYKGKNNSLWVQFQKIIVGVAFIVGGIAILFYKIWG